MAKMTFDYISAAEKMGKKGDYESALHYYFLQRNIERDEDLDIQIGDTYAAMGLVREAIRYYMRAYAADRHNAEILNRLVFCYKDIDEDAAFYYLSLVVKNEEDIEEFENFEFDDFGIPPLTVHDRRDKSEIMEQAIDLLAKGDAEEAKAAFESIGKDDYQYCDSVLARASMAMDKSNAEEALALAEEALSVNPKHLGTHVLKVMAFDALGDKKSAEEWINKLDLLDVRDEDEVTKAALCLCNFNCYDLAEKYILRKLEYTPYEKLMMLCLSAIYAAKGDKQRAFKIANRVCTIYPYDVEVKEITSRILSGKDVKMPEEMFVLKREWTQQIKQLFLENFDEITSPESIMKIRWLLQSEDDLYLQSAVCAMITGMPEYNSVIDEILIDPFAPAIVKKQILLRRVCDERTKRVDFVISNLFRSVKVRHPKAPDNLKYAYYYAFITMAIADIDFERKLTVSFKKLSAKFEQCADPKKSELPIDALASILFFMTEGGDLDNVLEIFDCEEQNYKNAAEMLGLQGRS